MSMVMSEIIKQLEDIVSHCTSMVSKDGPGSVWLADAEALDEVIQKLGNEYKGTDAAEIIRTIMKKEGVNQTIIAERMGCMRQNVSQMLTRGKANMRYDSFYKLAEALGYEVVVRKK